MKIIGLNNAKTLWGGKIVGAIRFHFLHSGVLTIYVTETKTGLMEKFKLTLTEKAIPKHVITFERM